MEKKIFEEAIGKLREIIESDERFRGNTYLVGGCIRDLLLGETPKDIDLCIDYPEGNTEFVDYLKENYSVDEVSGFTVFERYGTSRFTLHLSGDTKVEIECVIPRVESYNSGPRKPDQVKQTDIYEDAMRRDFCCNALYKNLETGEVLDPTGKGLGDLNDRILRTPLNPIETFIDDPLRMLRAIRFSCTKEFKILEDVENKIVDYKEYYSLSMERINDEFGKILMSGRAIEGIRLLTSTGLMKRIIPDFNEYLDFKQNNQYHSLTWYEHSLAVLEKVIQKNPNASLELRLAALLHDIAKPKCYQVKPDMSFSYHGHEKESAKRAEEILRELRYSVKTIEKVCFLIENHMIIKQFYDYNRKKYTGRYRITRKVLRVLGDLLDEEMELIEADNLSHSPKWNMVGQVSSFYSEVELLKNIDETKSSFLQQKAYNVPVTGNEIMSWFGLIPGPLVKEIKDVLQEIYEENPERTSTELLEEYKKRFEGYSFWFAKEDGESYLMFLGKPIKKKGSLWWSDKDGDIPYRIKKKDIHYQGILGEELSEQRGIYCPKLCMRFLRYKKVWGLVKALEKEVLGPLDGEDRFERLDISYEMHDLSMNIRFTDEEINIL